MKLKVVPSRQGAQWVRQGFQVFLRRPLAFSGLFAGFLFVALVVLVLPFVGSLLLLALLPLVTLGFMVATRTTLQGGFPLPGVFISPLRRDRVHTAALVRLGIIYAGASVATMLLSN